MNNISGIDEEVGVEIEIDGVNGNKYEIDASIKNNFPFRDESGSRDISDDPKSANMFSISENEEESSRPAVMTPREFKNNSIALTKANTGKSLAKHGSLNFL